MEIGFLFISLMTYSLTEMYDPPNFPCLLWLIAVLSTTDIVAFVSGRGDALLPNHLQWISPRKTRVGFCCGVSAASLVGVLVWTTLPPFKSISIIEKFLVSASIAVSAQCGDLLESFAKRLANVKDSNTQYVMLPGHGGVLDRLDSYILAAPLLIMYKNKFSTFT